MSYISANDMRVITKILDFFDDPDRPARKYRIVKLRKKSRTIYMVQKKTSLIGRWHFCHSHPIYDMTVAYSKVPKSFRDKTDIYTLYEK